MFYREYSPPPDLAGHIQCFWALEHDYRDSFHTHEHLWADTHVEVIFSFGEPYYQLIEGERKSLPANFVIGPFKKELLLYSDGLTGFVAVRFQPWGFSAFCKQPMMELINAIHPVEEVLLGVPALPGLLATGEVAEQLKTGDAAGQLEILGGWLRRVLEGRSGGPLCLPEIAGKICALNGIMRIGDVVAEFGVNPRRLERLFLAEIGMSAKLFARIIRFNHAKVLIERDPDISLASLTYETGYADQAHFSRNFREMFGYTPAQFKALVRGWGERMAGEEKDVVFLQDKS